MKQDLLFVADEHIRISVWYNLAMVYSVDVTTNSKMGSLWILLTLLILLNNEFVQAQLSDLGLQPGNAGSLNPGDAISFGGFNMPDAVATSIDNSGPLLDIVQNPAGFADSNPNLGYTQEPLVGATAVGSSASDAMSVSNSGMATFEISNSNTASETMKSATNQDPLQMDGTNAGVVDMSANNLPINSASLSIEGAAENTASVADAPRAVSGDSSFNVGSERVMFVPHESIIETNTGTVDTVGANIASSNTLLESQSGDMTGNQQLSNTVSDAVSSNQPLFTTITDGQSSVNSLTKTETNYQPQSHVGVSDSGSSSNNNVNANFDFSSISSEKVVKTVPSTGTTSTQTKTNTATRTQGASFDSSLFGVNNPEDPIIRQDLKGTVVLKQFMPLGQMPQDGSPSQVVEALKKSMMLTDVYKPSDNIHRGKQKDTITLPSGEGSIKLPGRSGIHPPPVNQGLYPAVTQDPWQAENQCGVVNKRKHRFDERYFEELVHNNWIKRRCAPGTIYEPTTCVCKRDVIGNKGVARTKGCNPDLWIDFTYGIQDISGNDFVTDQESMMQARRGVMCLDGHSKLRIWRYHSFDFRNQLYIRVRFKVTDANRTNPYPIISNCDQGDSEPSLGMVLGKYNDSMVIFLNTTLGMPTMVFPFILNEWNTATLKYDGEYVSASVNGYTKSSKRIRGQIRLRDESMMIGYCGRYGYLKGCVDDVTIYHCVPPGV